MELLNGTQNPPNDVISRELTFDMNGRDNGEYVLLLECAYNWYHTYEFTYTAESEPEPEPEPEEQKYYWTQKGIDHLKNDLGADDSELPLLGSEVTDDSITFLADNLFGGNKEATINLM